MGGKGSEDWRGETRILDKKEKSFGYHVLTKKEVAENIGGAKLMFEVNSVQGLLLFNCFPSKTMQIKLKITSHLSSINSYFLHVFQHHINALHVQSIYSNLTQTAIWELNTVSSG